MYIIYRVYKKSENHYDNEIITQDVMEVKEKDDFKNAIKLIYGNDIKFKNNKNVQPGDLFISIISYDCTNPEEYLNTMKCNCDYCKKEFISIPRNRIRLNIEYLNRINHDLFQQIKNELASKIYCSNKCRDNAMKNYNQIFREDAVKNKGFVDEWVYRESSFNDSGYIYMITKKSTGEFYVGKTNALPMFRWVQHLKTDRFPQENITDYKFEVLEVCKEKMTERETHWINKMHDTHPSNLCLNIIIPEEKIKLEDLLK